MDTTRSEQQLTRHRKQGFSARRKVQQYERRFRASPAELFPLLCPTREADWIPGWACDLVHTTTGYVERDCVFTTDDRNPFGAGTWVIHDHEEDARLELVKTSEQLILQMRIAIADAPDGGTLGRWTLSLTGLTPAGNALIDSMPDQDPRFLALLDALDHYLRSGRMVGC